MFFISAFRLLEIPDFRVRAPMFGAPVSWRNLDRHAVNPSRLRAGYYCYLSPTIALWIVEQGRNGRQRDHWHGIWTFSRSSTWHSDIFWSCSRRTQRRLAWDPTALLFTPPSTKSWLSLVTCPGRNSTSRITVECGVIMTVQCRFEWSYRPLQKQNVITTTVRLLFQPLTHSPSTRLAFYRISSPRVVGKVIRTRPPEHGHMRHFSNPSKQKGRHAYRC